MTLKKILLVAIALAVLSVLPIIRVKAQAPVAGPVVGGGGGGAALSGGTNTNAAFWTSASTLAANAFFTTTYSGASKTPVSPILKDAWTNGFYSATYNSGPSATAYVFDFSQDTSQDAGPAILFLDKNGHQGRIRSSNASGWSLDNISISGVPAFGTTPYLQTPINLAAQTASISTTSIAGGINGIGGHGRGLLHYSITSTSGTGNVTLTMNWFDPSSIAHSFTTAPLTTTPGTDLNGTLVINSATTTLTYSTTVVGTVNYRLYIQPVGML